MKGLLEGFKKYYGKNADRKYFSPGRVNLIGEHIDYSGGYVMPAAITLGTYVAVSPREDRIVRLYSENQPHTGVLEVSLDELKFVKELDWANYVLGVFWAFKEAGYELKHGFDLYFHGDLPNGCGLSSSASIEVLVAFIINDYYNLGVSRVEMAKLTKETENKYLGVNSGIMDQFIIANGEADSALFLNTTTLEYDVVPSDLGEYQIFILNTNKPRTLAASGYNVRRAQSDEGRDILAKATGKDQMLCHFTEKEIVEYQGYIKDDLVYNRCLHAISENVRVLSSKAALTKGELVEFGQLLYGSHESLSHLYEVSIPELDILVKFSRSFRGVLGARMTGAGFGGCAIALVHKDYGEKYTKAVKQMYKENTGIELDVYIANISKGVDRCTD